MDDFAQTPPATGETAVQWALGQNGYCGMLAQMITKPWLRAGLACAAGLSGVLPYFLVTKEVTLNKENLANRGRLNNHSTLPPTRTC